MQHLTRPGRFKEMLWGISGFLLAGTIFCGAFFLAHHFIVQRDKIKTVDQHWKNPIGELNVIPGPKMTKEMLKQGQVHVSGQFRPVLNDADDSVTISVTSGPPGGVCRPVSEGWITEATLNPDGTFQTQLPSTLANLGEGLFLLEARLSSRSEDRCLTQGILIEDANPAKPERLILSLSNSFLTADLKDVFQNLFRQYLKKYDIVPNQLLIQLKILPNERPAKIRFQIVRLTGTIKVSWMKGILDFFDISSGPITVPMTKFSAIVQVLLYERNGRLELEIDRSEDAPALIQDCEIAGVNIRWITDRFEWLIHYWLQSHLDDLTHLLPMGQDLLADYKNLSKDPKLAIDLKGTPQTTPSGDLVFFFAWRRPFSLPDSTELNPVTSIQHDSIVLKVPEAFLNDFLTIAHERGILAFWMNEGLKRLSVFKDLPAHIGIDFAPQVRLLPEKTDENIRLFLKAYGFSLGNTGKWFADLYAQWVLKDSWITIELIPHSDASRVVGCFDPLGCSGIKLEEMLRMEALQKYLTQDAQGRPALVQQIFLPALLQSELKLGGTVISLKNIHLMPAPEGWIVIGAW